MLIIIIDIVKRYITYYQAPANLSHQSCPWPQPILGGAALLHEFDGLFGLIEKRNPIFKAHHIPV